MPQKSESSPTDIVGATFAEFLGTLVLVWIPTTIAATTAAGAAIAGKPADSTAIALWFGVTLYVLVRSFATRSGANFNPAITLGLLVHGQMRLSLAVRYWIAQLLGGIIGSLMAHLSTEGISGVSQTGYGVTQPAHSVPMFTVAVVEFFGTALLTFVVATVALGKQSALDTALTIGATLGVLVAFGGPITGGAFNPARALGPMLTSGKATDWWLYVIMELLGSVLGVHVYLKGFRKVSQPE